MGGCRFCGIPQGSFLKGSRKGCQGSVRFPEGSGMDGSHSVNSFMGFVAFQKGSLRLKDSRRAL